MKLGDGYQYPINESEESSYRLESGKYLKMKDVLYVPKLKKNILFISTLDAKGIRVGFVDGQVLMWPKGNKIYDVTVIGEKEGQLVQIEGTTLTSISS